MVAYQVTQEIEIPRLRKMILSQLGLKDLVKKFDDEKNAYEEVMIEKIT